MKYVLPLLLIVLLIATLVTCDLPVHCLFHQIQGDWELRLGPSGQSNNVVNTCALNSTVNVKQTIRVTLDSPDVVRNSAGVNIGFWTLIYDQGFEIVFKGVSYFAFFNYTQQGDTVVSHCDRTFTGWYHTDEVKSSDWGCFSAMKVDSNPLIPATNEHKVQPFSAQNDEVFKNDHTYIQKLNEIAKKNGWEAAAYPWMEGMKVSELQRISGRKVEPWRRDALKRTTKLIKSLKSKKMQAKSRVQVPESWDWSNVDGVNYVSPVRDQKHCGSCYAFATMGMMEARVRIASKNKDQTIFSPQDIVGCSKYSQGCDGGFPYLIGKYAEDFGLTAEQCDPYLGEDSKCFNTCPASTKRLYGVNFQYVGGFYGASDEQNMMEEIYLNGPVVIGFEVYPDFRYYKKGVYKHTAAMKALNDPHDPKPWEEVNHAVLITGWGVTPDTNEKYWIVKNSWSDQWGNNGYFWILKGSDECGVESDVVATKVHGYM